MADTHKLVCTLCGVTLATSDSAGILDGFGYCTDDARLIGGAEGAALALESAKTLPIGTAKIPPPPPQAQAARAAALAAQAGAGKQ